MTRRLPSVRGAKVVSARERAGFHVHHVKGSHHVHRHPAVPGRRVVVPVHRKDLPTGILRSIIKQSGLGVEEFLKLL